MEFCYTPEEINAFKMEWSFTVKEASDLKLIVWFLHSRKIARLRAENRRIWICGTCERKNRYFSEKKLGERLSENELGYLVDRWGLRDGTEPLSSEDALEKRGLTREDEIRIKNVLNECTPRVSVHPFVRTDNKLSAL